MSSEFKAGLEDVVVSTSDICFTLEQHANDRVIRPRSEHADPTRATYAPLDGR